MAESPYSDERPVMPKLLLSIGTGKKEEASRFGLLSLVSFGVRSITNTAEPDQQADHVVKDIDGSEYFRFDVPHREASEANGHKGLNKVGLTECKKKRIRRFFSSDRVELPVDDAEPQSNLPSNEAQQIDESAVARHRARERDAVLRECAAASASDSSFNPQKFTYKTFDKIRDRTVDYIHQGIYRDSDLVQTRIEECARLLWSIALDRRRLTKNRWDEFRRHPDPSFGLAGSSQPASQQENAL